MLQDTLYPPALAAIVCKVLPQVPRNAHRIKRSGTATQSIFPLPVANEFSLHRVAHEITTEMKTVCNTFRLLHCRVNTRFTRPFLELRWVVNGQEEDDDDDEEEAEEEEEEEKEEKKEGETEPKRTTSLTERMRGVMDRFLSSVLSARKRKKNKKKNPPKPRRVHDFNLVFPQKLMTDLTSQLKLPASCYPAVPHLLLFLRSFQGERTPIDLHESVEYDAATRKVEFRLNGFRELWMQDVQGIYDRMGQDGLWTDVQDRVKITEQQRCLYITARLTHNTYDH
jgi:hypothetical protein